MHNNWKKLANIMGHKLIDYAAGEDRYQLGNWGEQLAHHYLRACGFRLLKSRYRRPGFELDLIMEKEGWLAGIEVKTSKDPAVELFELIRPLQVMRMQKGLRVFATENRLQDWPQRMLAVLIWLKDDSRPVIAIEELL